MPAAGALYRFSPYSLALLGSGLLVLAVSLLVWPRRRAPGGIWLFWLLISSAEWTLLGTLEAAAATIPLKYLWSQVTYLGITTGPAFYLLFAYHFTGAGRPLRRREIALLLLPAALTCLVAWTNGRHHWLWTGLAIDPATLIGTYGHGGWFWFLVAYNYLCALAGTLLLLRAVVRFPTYYRGQLFPILLGSSLPVAGNLLYVFDLGPIEGLDLTPISFSLVGVLLAWALLRHQMLQLMPVARGRLVESMQDGVLVLDSLGRVVDANPAACRLLHIGPPCPIGQPVSQALADWPDFSAALAAGRESVELNVGEPLQLSLDVRVSPLVDRAHRAIGQLVVLRDVTRRKQAEQALHDLNTRLETLVAQRTAEISAEQEKSETILRSVGDAITLLDLDLRIQYANRAFETLTGLPAAEAVGRPLAEAAAWLDPDAALQAIAPDLAAGLRWQGQVTGRHRTGRRYHAALLITPVRHQDGALVGYVAAHHDNSARHELERARDQFLGNVSHEFRTPLTSVKLYIHLLQTGPKEKADHYLRVLAEQAARLESLVQDVIEITALDAGQAPGVWETIALPALAGAALARFQQRAAAAGLALELEPPPAGLPPVSGDPARVGRALSELLDNALAFTPAGGRVSLALRAVTESGAPWVTLSVSDTGPGIPLEEQERIYDRFFRGRAAEEKSPTGTGLGLSLVREIIRHHGGRVTLDSQPGRGSTFTLWLPAAA